MAKRKTRIVREKRKQDGQSTVPVSVSHIDLEMVKQRYAGKALPEDDEYFEEYDGEKQEQEQLSRRVMDADRELNIFGEDEEEAPAERRGLIIAFLAAMFITVLAGLYFFLMVDSIKVGGNNTLEKGEVLTIAGLNPGEHIWLADISGAKARLMADPMIKEASVKRIYPDTISITITERRPAAAIVSGGTVAIIDADGRVMKITSTVPDNMVEVYGVSSVGFTAGQDISKDSHFNTDALLKILTALDVRDILGIISTIDMSQPLRIEMNTVYGIHVNVGQADNIEEKLNDLSAVITKVMTMGYQGGTIDLAVLGDPVYTPVAAEPEIEEDSDNATENQGEMPDGQLPSPEATPVQPAVTPTPSAGGNSGGIGFSG